MATHSSILAWRIPGQRSPAGYSPWGHEELDMTVTNAFRVYRSARCVSRSFPATACLLGQRLTPCLTVPQGYASSGTLLPLSYQLITVSWKSVISNVDITKMPSVHLKMDFIALPCLKVRGNVYRYYDQLGSHSQIAQSPTV